MAKRLNILILVVFLLGQTIIGPIGSTAGFVSAAEEDGQDEEAQETKTVEVEKNALENALADAEDYDEADYEANSYAAFVDAVTAGEDVVENEAATQDEVDNAVTAIEKAIDALQKQTTPEDDEGDAKESDKEEGAKSNEDADAAGKNAEEGEAEVDEEVQTTPRAATMQSEGEEDEYEDEIELNDDHIKGFTFKVNGKEFTKSGTIEGVSNEDEFELVVDLVDPLEFDKLNYGPGTELKYPLPEGFSDHFTYSDNLGPLSNYGDVKIEDDFVVIKLNENILIGNTPSDIKEGTFEIKGNFSDDNDEWGKDIVMPGGETFTVNFKPKSGEGVTIDKEDGTPYKGDDQTNQKSDKIEWTVTVNTNLANDSDSPKFVDELSSNKSSEHSHKYDKKSVEIYEIDVRPDGTENIGDEKVENITPKFFENDTKMEINLDPGKAYKIKYTTKLDNPGVNENIWYYNSAKYDKKTDNSSVYVDFGKAINKKASGPNTELVTEWTIEYNYNEQEIPKKTTVTDKWTVSGTDQTDKKQILDETFGKDGIKIVGVNGGPVIDEDDYIVSYDEAEQEIKIQFNTEFDFPIDIKYKTKPNDNLKVDENFTVHNEANHGHITTAKAKEDVEYNTKNLTLNKTTVDSIDYDKKEMDWRITANQAGYQLKKDDYFKDKFTNENMKLVENSLVVKFDGETVDKGTAYELTEDTDRNGFEVKLLTDTKAEVVIEYTTSFKEIEDTIDDKREKNYKNEVTLHAKELPNKPYDSASRTPKDEHKENGSKDGSYNYETKEFTWTIIFNYNSNTLNEAVLKDVLPEEHEITSARLEKGHIDSDGEFEADETLTADITGSNSFELNLGKIKEPHKLVYTTKMKDDVFPVDGKQNYSVENKAELFDGDTPDPNASWEKKVTVENTEKVLDQKNGAQKGNTTTIEWDFLYNTAQSKLTDVKISDTFVDDPNTGMTNQVIDEETLKVYKVTYTGETPWTPKEAKTEMDPSEYDVSFDTEDGATFTLEFKELDHAIYVEYESVFIGLKDSPISNKLGVTFFDTEDAEDSNEVEKMSFTYGAFASTSAGEFVVIKTDEATGEPMKDVEFTLERGNRTIMSGTTDENGVLDFGMPFATGTYKLTEEKQDGYESLDNFEFKLEADGGPYEGKQVVNVTNTPTEYKDKMCPNFKVTVKDEEDNPFEKDKTIKLVNKETGQIFEEKTDESGQIVKDREDLPAGDYKVYEIDHGEDIFIDELEVRYAGEDNTECNAEIRPDVIDIPVTKTWKDGDLDNEERPDITIQLLADGDKPEKVKLDETNVSDDNDNVWEYTFENLRKMNNAGTEEIKYTVEELDVEGYKSEVNEYNITNTRTSDTPVEVEVTKEWIGETQDKVTINLLANGETVDDQSIELLEADNWEGSFKDLAKYDDEGEEIEYSVKEVEVDGYNTDITGDAEDGFTVTNTQKTYAIGDYVWVDYNSDGTQDESADAALEGVTVELYEKDGEEPIETTTTDENGLYIFDELVAGEYQVKFILTEEQAEQYKFTEQNADDTDATNDSDADEETGWTEVIKLDDENEQLITDYDAQDFEATEGIDPTWDAGVIELTEVTVNKTWVDDNDATGDRPASIKVNLKQNGTVVEEAVEIEANDDGEWTHTFTGLTKYLEEGKEYEYTVTEHDVAGYTTEIDGFEITNTRSEEKSITITKGWKDDNNPDRPDSIEVELLRSVDGDVEATEVDGSPYTVKAEDDWSLTIDKLPAFDDNGKAYTYTIVEIPVAGYDSTVDGFDITNLRVGTTEVSGEKIWDHKDAKDHPEAITVNLLQNGKAIDSQDVTADDHWIYEFTDLAEFDENGVAYTYTVVEDVVAEYNSVNAEEGYDITNTRKTYAIGDYVWIDRNKDGIQDEDEEPLAKVKVELYDKDGSKIAETETDKNGRYIFDELVSGDYQVKFTLTEDQAQKYKFTIRNADDSDATNDSDADAKGYTTQFTLDEDNEHLTLNEDYEYQDVEATEGIDPTWDAGVIELVDVTVTKTWVNDHNESEELPVSITVNLLANGEEVDSQEVTAEDDWTYTFTNLDQYDENGVEIKYSVEEIAVDGYETSYDGFDITNTKLCEKFTVEVEDENGDPVTEEEYTFESEDGEKITKTTDKDGKVTFDREELPEGKYTVIDKDGNKVGEIEVEYKVDCKDNIKTVILDPEDPEDPVTPEKPKEEDPKTCEEVEITVTEDGKPSKNKTYTLTSTDGKTKVTITTDKDGKVTIDREALPNGTYTVTDKDGNVVGKVEITDDCVVELDITSESDDIIGKILPKTATQTFAYIALGLGLLVLGIIFQAARRRHKA